MAEQTPLVKVFEKLSPKQQELVVAMRPHLNEGDGDKIPSTVYTEHIPEGLDLKSSAIEKGYNQDVMTAMAYVTGEKGVANSIKDEDFKEMNITMSDGIEGGGEFAVRFKRESDQYDPQAKEMKPQFGTMRFGYTTEFTRRVGGLEQIAQATKATARAALEGK